MASLSDYQKLIYNRYLKALAAAGGRPYRERKNFEEVENDIAACQYLATLERLFKRYDFVNVDKFFKVNFEYTGQKYLPLQHFTRNKCFSVYMRLVQSMELNDHEEEETLSDEEKKDFLSGFRFISDFCQEQGIPMRKYTELSNHYTVPYYLLHIQEKKIHFHHLHALGLALFEVPKDYCELVCPYFVERFVETAQDFDRSPFLRNFREKLRAKMDG